MDGVTFSCPHCGQSLEAQDDMGGLAIDCPICKSPLVVPKVNATMLANDESEMSPASSPCSDKSSESPAVAAISCKKCGSPMPADGVICIQCGFDSRTGKQILTAIKTDSATSSAKAGVRAPLPAFSSSGRPNALVYLVRALMFGGFIHGLVRGSEALGFTWNAEFMTPVRVTVKIAVLVLIWFFFREVVRFFRALGSLDSRKEWQFAAWYQGKLGKRPMVFQVVLWLFYGFFWIPAWYLVATLLSRKKMRS